MDRRKFLTAALAAPLAAGLDPFSTRAVAVPTAGWRTFEITTRVSLRDSTGPAQLWLPLAQTDATYQRALDLHWEGNDRTELLRDDRYGAPMLRTTWENNDKPQNIEVVQTVAVRDRATAPFVPFTEAERRFWTAPTAGTPTDGIVRETADFITMHCSSPGERLRTIYDWVVDHTHRDPDVPGCGLGDIQQSLASGKLGGKCADINSLLVGLARAVGFPAREVYGLRVAPSSLYPCLGRSGDVTKAQHCRAEVYSEGYGWFPIDPADVRKVVLEQKLALDSKEGHALRERMFGSWEMNWIGYNSATGIVLPGNGSPKPDFSFLMYPSARTSQGQVPCLDPARFHYEITSRELTA